MKCWECKKEINKARIVHYISIDQEKEASRDICYDCLSKLKFNPCHYVEVRSIRQRALKQF